MLDHENMQRILKSSDGKKPVAVLKSQNHFNPMGEYTNYQGGNQNLSPKSGARKTADIVTPISTGEA